MNQPNPAHNEFYGYTIVLVVILLGLMSNIGLAFTFRKAGYKPYLAFIPILNLVHLVKLAEYKPIMALLFILPLVQIVFYLNISDRLANRFGRSGIFAIGIMFFPFIFLLILGLGGSTYRKVSDHSS